MKKALLLLLCVAFPGAEAAASGLRMTVEQRNFTWVGIGGNFPHVAFAPGAPAGDLGDAA